MKIGLFDSGIGGLNVLKEFINKYPNNQYYYYGDTLNVPYGDKDKNTLLYLSSKIIKFFIKIKVDIIIVACGTISSNCVEELRNLTDIPIFDIISPTIDYFKKNKYEKILVFGTKKTIESHIFKNNIDNIMEVETPEFVPMIENNQIDSNIIKKYIESYKDMEILILGCTHYPLLIDEFKKYFNKDILIIDMGKILIKQINLKNNSKYSLNLFFTKINDQLIKNINNIINTDFKLTIIK